MRPDSPGSPSSSSATGSAQDAAGVILSAASMSVVESTEVHSSTSMSPSSLSLVHIQQHHHHQQHIQHHQQQHIQHQQQLKKLYSPLLSPSTLIADESPHTNGDHHSHHFTHRKHNNRSLDHNRSQSHHGRDYPLSSSDKAVPASHSSAQTTQLTPQEAANQYYKQIQQRPPARAIPRPALRHPSTEHGPYQQQINYPLSNTASTSPLLSVSVTSNSASPLLAISTDPLTLSSTSSNHRVSSPTQLHNTKNNTVVSISSTHYSTVPSPVESVEHLLPLFDTAVGGVSMSSTPFQDELFGGDGFLVSSSASSLTSSSSLSLDGYMSSSSRSNHSSGSNGSSSSRRRHRRDINRTGNANENDSKSSSTSNGSQHHRNAVPQPPPPPPLHVSSSLEATVAVTAVVESVSTSDKPLTKTSPPRLQPRVNMSDGQTPTAAAITEQEGDNNDGVPVMTASSRSKDASPLTLAANTKTSSTMEDDVLDVDAMMRDDDFDSLVSDLVATSTPKIVAAPPTPPPPPQPPAASSLSSLSVSESLLPSSPSLQRQGLQILSGTGTAIKEINDAAVPDPAATLLALCNHENAEALTAAPVDSMGTSSSFGDDMDIVASEHVAEVVLADQNPLAISEMSIASGGCKADTSLPMVEKSVGSCETQLIHSNTNGTDHMNVDCSSQTRNEIVNIAPLLTHNEIDQSIKSVRRSKALTSKVVFNVDTAAERKTELSVRVPSWSDDSPNTPCLSSGDPGASIILSGSCVPLERCAVAVESNGGNIVAQPLERNARLDHEKQDKDTESCAVAVESNGGNSEAVVAEPFEQDTRRDHEEQDVDAAVSAPSIAGYPENMVTDPLMLLASQAATAQCIVSPIATNVAAATSSAEPGMLHIPSSSSQPPLQSLLTPIPPVNISSKQQVQHQHQHASDCPPRHSKSIDAQSVGIEPSIPIVYEAVPRSSFDLSTQRLQPQRPSSISSLSSTATSPPLASLVTNQRHTLRVSAASNVLPSRNRGHSISPLLTRETLPYLFAAFLDLKLYPTCKDCSRKHATGVPHHLISFLKPLTQYEKAVDMFNLFLEYRQSAVKLMDALKVIGFSQPNASSLYHRLDKWMQRHHILAFYRHLAGVCGVKDDVALETAISVGRGFLPNGVGCVQQRRRQSLVSDAGGVSAAAQPTDSIIQSASSHQTRSVDSKGKKGVVTDGNCEGEASNNARESSLPDRPSKRQRIVAPPILPDSLSIANDGIIRSPTGNRQSPVIECTSECSGGNDTLSMEFADDSDTRLSETTDFVDGGGSCGQYGNERDELDRNGGTSFDDVQTGDECDDNVDKRGDIHGLNGECSGGKDTLSMEVADNSDTRLSETTDLVYSGDSCGQSGNMRQLGRNSGAIYGDVQTGDKCDDNVEKTVDKHGRNRVDSPLLCSTLTVPAQCDRLVRDLEMIRDMTIENCEAKLLQPTRYGGERAGCDELRLWLTRAKFPRMSIPLQRPLPYSFPPLLLPVGCRRRQGLESATLADSISPPA